MSDHSQLTNMAASHALARGRALEFDLARALARDLDKLVGSTATAPADREGVVSAVAERVVTRLVRLLPAVSRSRYREEFAAELDELAAAGLSRCGQLGYVVCLGTRVWSLRGALRARTADVRRA